MFDKQCVSDTQMATELDKAKPAQIKQWQSENILYWIYESYQIRSQLYSEVKSGSKIDDAYYQKHIGTVNERIEKAGIRLAGVLNEVFRNYKPSSLQVKESVSTSKEMVQSPLMIADNEASKHIGEFVTVYGKITGNKELGSMLLVNMGGEYPNQTVTIVLRGEAKRKAKMRYLTDKFLNDQMKVDVGDAMTATGTLTLFKPQIEVSNPEYINVVTITKTN
jgi:hypothetical protein